MFPAIFTALHVVLDGRVLWVLLAPVTPIHLTLYMFPETVSLLCMWYATAAVVLDCRGGIPLLLWYSTSAVVFHFCCGALLLRWYSTSASLPGRSGWSWHR